MKITAEIIEHNGGGSANVRIALTQKMIRLNVTGTCC